MLLVVAGLAPEDSVRSQSTGPNYELTSSAIAGGGGPSVADGYSLEATMGQSDASGVLRGGIYEVAGGFQPLASDDPLFRNGFE